MEYIGLSNKCAKITADLQSEVIYYSILDFGLGNHIIEGFRLTIIILAIAIIITNQVTLLISF